MISLDTLVAEREITRSIYLFARAMDARDWPALHSIMTEDATGDLGTGPLHGRAAIIAVMRAFLDDCGPTQHLIGNVIVEIDGDCARSRAYVSDTHLGQADQASATFSTLGDYEDHWRKIDNCWRMTHRTKHNRATIGDITILGAGPANWQNAG